MSLEELKRRIMDKCDIAQAIYALSWSITPRHIEIFEGTRELLKHGNRSQLEHAEFVLDVNIQTAENAAGYKGGDDFALELGRGYREGKFELMQYPKVVIDEWLFERYQSVFSTWKKIQPHGLIRIDLGGKDKDLYLPEASLYEDMCFAFNQCWESSSERTVPDQRTKARIKAHIFYTRASIISAYNFVECYLNGLAFDFLMTAQCTVSHEDRDVLNEWDTPKNRQKFVKFRDKITQYPKIILKRKTPPFTESSCPPMATLLSNINYRDAVVHNTPKPNLAGDEIPKVRDLIELRMEDAGRIVDAAVELVLLVDKTVNQGRYDMSWLLRRTTKGPFPAKSFA
jgi:hypothetical protein